MSESARKIIAAVPTSADELRNAIAALQAENEKAAGILTRSERLRSLEQDATEAQAAVDGIVAAQTEALREWAASGAEGEAPRVNERASREAAQRLETALRQRQASQAATAELAAEYAGAMAAVKAAETGIKVAAANVLGPEALDKYERYRRQVMELVVLECEISSARTRLLRLQLPNASAFGEELGTKLRFDRFPNAEKLALEQRGAANESGRWEAILRGDV